MSTLLHVDASFRADGSTSRAIADSATAAWLAEHSDGVVVHRDLSAAPLPADAWAQSVEATFVPPERWSTQQRAAKELAGTLADEVIDADVLLLASPLFNFGVSQYTKVWIDMLITDPGSAPAPRPWQASPR